jgi:hypothetical protein
MVRLHFGKYKGYALEDVPFDYLAWCDRELRDLDPWLRRAIAAELERRTGAASNSGTDGSLANVEAVLGQWYRELSLRFHPDRGGSHEAMKAINYARDRLLELLEAS